jgi:hypothetical protein
MRLVLGWLILLAGGFATAQASGQAGFASREEAVNRFVAALEANDKQALLALLIPRDQYRDVIIPGSVEPGQPLRQWTEKSRQYFADSFFAKSDHYADVLLKDWGGRKLTQKKVYFTRPAKAWATYIAHGELRIEVEADPPVDQEPVIRTGYIAEIDGSFAFVGFLHDDD